MTRVVDRLSSQRGFALVPAMIVTGLLLALGFSASALVSGETKTGSDTRKRESAFTLAESVLNLQSFLLGASWPTATNPYNPSTAGSNASCLSSEAHGDTDKKCPDPARLASGTFTTPDFAAGTYSGSWSTHVRDNGAYDIGGQRRSFRSFWDERLITLAPAYDENGDREMWVRAQGKVRGRTRTLVARVRLEPRPETLPLTVISAGSLGTSSNGNYTGRTCDPNPGSGMICSGDSPLTLHNCSRTTITDTCLTADTSNQISPPASVTADGNTSFVAIPPDTLARLKQTAQLEGTYCGPTGSSPGFCDGNGCPITPRGSHVYAVGASGLTCSYDTNDCPFINDERTCNEPNNPGIFIIERGRFHLSGQITYNGVIYNANKDALIGDATQCGNNNDFPGNVVLIGSGNVTVAGAIYADNGGGVCAGSNGVNVNYDQNAVLGVQSFLNAGIVQNTFREVVCDRAVSGACA